MTIPNARPYDLIKQEIDDLFDEAKVWLDGSEIATEAEAAQIEKLLALIREAETKATTAKKAETGPIDAQRKEIMDRYNPLGNRVDLIKIGCRKVLTVWRNKLAKQQAEAAEQARKIAEEAKAKAEHVAEVAGDSVELQEIVAGAHDTAERLSKNAERQAKLAGTGLRMRSVFTVELIEPKQAIAFYWRQYPDEISDWIAERLRAKITKGQLSGEVPGVNIVETKEAY